MRLRFKQSFGQESLIYGLHYIITGSDLRMTKQNNIISSQNFEIQKFLSFFFNLINL